MIRPILALFFSFSFLIPAVAYIPPARMILERTAENAGSGSYTIEQEVQFPNGPEPLVVKETWTIENDRSMRVTVTGLREQKDSLRLQILYAGGQRWIMRDGGRKESGPIPADFAERFFHWRTLDTAIMQLTALKIVPASALQKKPLPRRASDFKNEIPDYVRLSRSAGVVSWAFGLPASPSGAELTPGLWIEQDQFVIRKVRLPSQAEIIAENYTIYPRGLQFPKVRHMHWGTHSASIRVLSITGRGARNLSTSSLDTGWKTQGLAGQPAKEILEEFYTRFR
jgi:hypothetical protein